MEAERIGILFEFVIHGGSVLKMGKNRRRQNVPIWQVSESAAEISKEDKKARVGRTCQIWQVCESHGPCGKIASRISRKSRMLS